MTIREQSWELRQPQDFVRGVRDDQTVPMPLPRQLETFQGPMESTLTVAYSQVNPNPPWFLYVESSVRWFIGDVLNVMTDLGVMAVCIILDVPNQTSVQIDRNLTYSAAIGNVVVNTSAVSDPIITYPGPYSGSGPV